MPDRASGPIVEPVSLSWRHRPRNGARPTSGEKSAPSVITMPEPMPLPNPSAQLAASTAAKVWANGSATRAAAMMSIDGTATAARPRTSMTLPAG